MLDDRFTRPAAPSCAAATRTRRVASWAGCVASRDDGPTGKADRTRAEPRAAGEAADAHGTSAQTLQRQASEATGRAETAQSEIARVGQSLETLAGAADRNATLADHPRPSRRRHRPLDDGDENGDRPGAGKGGLGGSLFVVWDLPSIDLREILGKFLAPWKMLHYE